MSQDKPDVTQPKTNQSRPQKRRPRMSIKLDRVDPRDFMTYDMVYACEHCSHFDSRTVHCTMGYNPQHTLTEQLRRYNLSGFMAFCRFLEID